MRLVIDVPEELYEAYKGRPPCLGDEGMDTIAQSIANVTPLPKGHGRLIDEDELKRIINKNDVFTMAGFNVRLCDINNTPTIIEADKAEGEEA